MRLFAKGGESVFSIQEVKLDLEHEDFTYYDIFMTGGKTEYMGTNEVSLLIW